MKYTLILGAPVMAGNNTLGHVERILVNAGVANQFTVNPGLLGTERVVPLSDVRHITEHGIELRTSDKDWKAYPALNIEETMPEAFATTDPGLAELAPQHPDVAAHRPSAGVPAPSADVSDDDVTTHEYSAVLSSKTRVYGPGGEAQALHGVVLDTGRPVQLLVEGGEPIAVKTVSTFTSDEIRV